MVKFSVIATALLLGPNGIHAFSTNLCMKASSSSTSLSSTTISRRDSFFKTASFIGVGSAVFSSPAFADVSEETPLVTTRMGGLLEKYQDGSRGWKILAPSGWNKFEGEVGAYDTKWQDVVEPRENIKISSSPVKSTTTSMYVIRVYLQRHIVLTHFLLL